MGIKRFFEQFWISLKNGHEVAMAKVKVREFQREQKRLDKEERDEDKDSEDFMDSYIG